MSASLVKSMAQLSIGHTPIPGNPAPASKPKAEESKADPNEQLKEETVQTAAVPIAELLYKIFGGEVGAVCKAANEGKPLSGVTEYAKCLPGVAAIKLGLRKDVIKKHEKSDLLEKADKLTGYSARCYVAIFTRTIRFLADTKNCENLTDEQKTHFATAGYIASEYEGSVENLKKSKIIKCKVMLMHAKIDDNVQKLF